MGGGDGLHCGGAVGPDQGLTYLFYDGSCGLCSRAMQFVAGRERSGQVRFAPLGGEAFQRLVPEPVRTGLPDSLLVCTPVGEHLVRSAAVIHLLGQMGPGWRLAGVALTLIPVRLRDWTYDRVASRRRKVAACAWRPAAGDPRFES